MKNASIKTQITASILIFCILSLVTISVISIANVSIVSDDTRDLATESLEDQIIRNMEASSIESASVIERKLITAQSVIHTLVTATEEMFADDSPLGYRESYFDLQLPPDAVYNENYKGSVSMEYSTYYIPESTNETLEGMKTESMNDTIDRSANLDFFFQPVIEQHPDFWLLYVGFEEGKIFRAYPGGSRPNRQYDPTERGWYKDARNAPKGTIIITEPYKGATTGDWMISVAEAVYDGDGDLLGVVSGDLLINTIQEKVLDVSFLDTGYAALIQNDADGTVVAHPDWSLQSNVKVKISDVEDDSITQVILTEITTNKAGVVTYVRNQQTRYLAHAPILGQFVLLISVLREEAIAVVEDIDDHIESAEDSVKSTTLGLSFIIFLLVLGIGLWLGKTIATPLENLSNVAMQLSQNVTKSNLMEGIKLDLDMNRDDEIGALTQSFSKMVNSLSDEQRIDMELK